MYALTSLHGLSSTNYMALFIAGFNDSLPRRPTKLTTHKCGKKIYDSLFSDYVMFSDEFVKLFNVREVV